LAQVTAAKAVITKDSGDMAMAEDALRDYVKYQASQPNPKTPASEDPKLENPSPKSL
jgi:hypothetical protein